MGTKSQLLDTMQELGELIGQIQACLQATQLSFYKLPHWHMKTGGELIDRATDLVTEADKRIHTLRALLPELQAERTQQRGGAV